ncbi:beta-carotene isomerase D27, chloroplastic isoform X2 [Andrographis paniculata]|uniref:beta-carotene isomerase D27, chloroplastic isoform X2 n=1 Tax=Andrographis paniculata TaxID=175694 RepID=UPI0021E75CCC|nr:beta-carotene isomerase D27, chloroplastic isoform X2 [Andrographis paniculata]
MDMAVLLPNPCSRSRTLLSLSSPLHSPRINSRSARITCFSTPSDSSVEVEPIELKPLRKEYVPGGLDDIFLNLFRSKMAGEIGWDSEKPGYDGLIDTAHRMMAGRSNAEATNAAVRILRSLFPPLLLDLYKMLVSPIAGGRVAAEMWLMGTCTVNSVDLPDGSSWSSGVFVEKCKYLEESKCVGVCVNTCKLPTQVGMYACSSVSARSLSCCFMTFFKEYMGVPLVMEPNLSDYSCQFKFGVLPPRPEEDSVLKEPCLQICPTAIRRQQIPVKASMEQPSNSKCPKA